MNKSVLVLVSVFFSCSDSELGPPLLGIAEFNIGDFGMWAAGTELRGRIGLTNIGESPLRIEEASIEKDARGGFQISTNLPLPWTIPAPTPNYPYADILSVTVDYTLGPPEVADDVNLLVMSNDPLVPEARWPMAGQSLPVGFDGRFGAKQVLARGSSTEIHNEPVAAAESDNVVVTWRKTVQEQEPELMVASSTDGGRSWGEPQVLDPSVSLSGPAITSGGANSWLIAWTGSTTLSLACSEDAGATWRALDPPPEINTSGNVALASDGHGTFMLLVELIDGIYSTTSTTCGEHWQPKVSVLPRALENQAYDRRLAHNVDDSWIVAYRSNPSMPMLIRSDDGGQSWSSPIPVSPALHLNSSFHLDFDSDSSGNLAAAFISFGDRLPDELGRMGRGGTDEDVFVVTSIDAGRSWSDPIQITPADDGRDFKPKIAATSSGWSVVWESTSTLQGRIEKDEDILISESEMGSTEWKAPLSVVASAESDDIPDEQPSKVVRTSSGLLLFWRSEIRDLVYSYTID